MGQETAETWTAQTLLQAGRFLRPKLLASGRDANAHEALLGAWMKMMAAEDVRPEGRERMRAAYDKDVAILPAGVVASLIASAGFKEPVQFFQAGLLHAWLSRRASSNAA